MTSFEYVIDTQVCESFLRLWDVCAAGEAGEIFPVGVGRVESAGHIPGKLFVLPLPVLEAFFDGFHLLVIVVSDLSGEGVETDRISPAIQDFAAGADIAVPDVVAIPVFFCFPDGRKALRRQLQAEYNERYDGNDAFHLASGNLPVLQI